MNDVHFRVRNPITSRAMRLTTTVAGLLLLTSIARAERRENVPESLEVPAGNRVSFRAHGVGVQIYVWTVNPATSVGSWVFKAPHAVLFREDEVVGVHFAGPTWESNSGSEVVGQKLASVTVEPSAIPWLLLKAKTTSGEGVFEDVTFIQRLYTMGGLAPATPGTTDGEERLVPYIAEYVFYRAAL